MSCREAPPLTKDQYQIKRKQQEQLALATCPAVLFMANPMQQEIPYAAVGQACICWVWPPPPSSDPLPKFKCDRLPQQPICLPAVVCAVTTARAALQLVKGLQWNAADSSRICSHLVPVGAEAGEMQALVQPKQLSWKHRKTAVRVVSFARQSSVSAKLAAGQFQHMPERTHRPTTVAWTRASIPTDPAASLSSVL